MRTGTQANISPSESKARKLRKLAWLVWSIAVIAQLFNQFHRVAAAVAVDRIMADFQITAAVMGSVIAVFFYTYAAMQVPSGILADYLGPRRTLTYGCLATAVGSVIFGLAPSLSLLYLGRFLVSLGVSVVFISLLKLQAEWFPSRHFGRMTSMTAVLSQIGLLAGTTPMALMVMRTGWRLSFEMMGLLGFALSLACWVIVRDKPADMGLPSPNMIDRQPDGSTVAVPPVAGAAGSFGERLKVMLTNKHIWPPFLLGVGLYGTLLTIQGAWGVPYLMQVYDMSRDMAANLVLLTVIGFMVGVATIGLIYDRIQKRKLLAIVCTFSYLSLWLMLTFWNGGKPPAPALYPIFLLMGYFNGFTPVIYDCAKEAVPSYISGIALGFVNMSIFVSVAIFQTAFGNILDLYWQGAIAEGARVYPLVAFQSGLIVICLGVLASVVGALLLKEKRDRDQQG